MHNRVETHTTNEQVSCPECAHRGAVKLTVKRVELPPDYMSVRWKLGRLGGPRWQERSHLSVGYDPVQLREDFSRVLTDLAEWVRGRDPGLVEGYLAESKRLLLKVAREREAETVGAAS